MGTEWLNEELAKSNAKWDKVEGELKWAIQAYVNYITTPGPQTIPPLNIMQHITDNPILAVYQAYKLGLEDGKNGSISKTGV